MRSGFRKWFPVVFILPLIASVAVAGEQGALSQEEIQQQLAGFYFAAARAGDNAVLHEFIDAGFDLETADENGYTALILAAYNGRGDTVRLLLDAGANACTEDKRGNTALLGAIFKGELRIARQLMKADCDLNQPNLAGQTPAMFAALFQRLELLGELARQGADLDVVDRMGNSAANLAEGRFATGQAGGESRSSTALR